MTFIPFAVFIILAIVATAWASAIWYRRKIATVESQLAAVSFCLDNERDDYVQLKKRFWAERAERHWYFKHLEAED